MDPVVIVVEDEPSLNRAMEALLMSLGASPVCFSSAEEAWSAARHWQGRCCCAFIDVTLPGASGLDLAHHLRDRCPQLPIVLTSGLKGVWSLVALEPVRYMTKPFGLHEISEALAWSVTCLTGPAAETSGRAIAS
jgi:FixJ family two-component response regulator